MKEVWFIRHGESLANAGLKTSNHSTIPMTYNGNEQALFISNEIIRKPDLIIISKFTRTYQTAEPTIKKFKDSPVKVLEIQEYNYLVKNRCINSTALERKPMVNEYFERCDVNFVDGADAESFLQFNEIIYNSLKILEQTDKEYIVVFTHGNVMRMIYQIISNKIETVNNQTMRYFYDFTQTLEIPNIHIMKTTVSHKKMENMLSLQISLLHFYIVFS